MRDLNKYAKICLEEVKAAGIIPGNIQSFEINSRALKRFGCCKRNNLYNTYVIEVSVLLLDERIPEIQLKDTIIHEILHSCKDCMTHKNEWKRNAEIMNRKYGYNISRTGSCKEFSELKEEIKPAKYILKCKECGKEYPAYRMSKSVKHPEFYRCGKCGGNLIRIK